MGIKLICFDLDDTLIRDIHSVMLPCILNGKEKEHSLIQEKEETGQLDYISADYLRAELFWGLEVNEIHKRFLDIAKPLQNIPETINYLHSQGILCLLITVGPIQVAMAVSTIYGFDGYYGSHYEVVSGKFTGKILNYIKAENKINCLDEYCRINNIDAADCIAVGDGSTDIPIFKYCGKSIAINASDKVKNEATYIIDTDNLIDILKFLK